MAMKTTGTPEAFLPEDYGNLLIATATPLSVAMSTTTVVTTDSNTFHIPTITGEVTAAWVDELAEIAPSDATLAEEVVRPRKLAALTKISNELRHDSTPQAAEVIGQSIARDIANQIDAAFFGTGDGTGVPPKGLGALDGVTEVATTAVDNLDAFIEATYTAEALGANLSVFVANPADAQALAQLKRETTSNVPLLAPAASEGTTRQLAGIPMRTSPHVRKGTIYGYDTRRVYTVVRKDVEVQVDDSVYFTSDSSAVRGVARVAFGYPHAASIIRIKIG